MGRYRDTGIGSLKQASGKWYVRFTTYQRGKPKQHCFQVGPTNVYDCLPGGVYSRISARKPALIGAGNAVSPPVAEWIGRRIIAAEGGLSR